LKILYFSLIDWDFIYQRPQHLAERLSSKNDFTYVQPFGLRNLRFSDFHRVFRRFQSLFKRLDVKRGLHIKDFFFIPIIAPSITKINPFLLRYQMNSHVDSETIIWVTYPSPLMPGILEGMKYGALVYEMMDDYPKVHPRSEEDIRRVEAWFVDKAALVITTSEALAEKAERIKKGVRIRVIGNGVDYDFFNNGPKVRPLEFKGLEKIIGYVGTISEWIDFELVDYLAENRPDLNFIFVGPIRAKRLPLKKNIRFIDTIDYEKVPAYCNGFDVCLIPFQRGEFADAVNPVKLFEYLALGKPVVSSYMRELERYKDVIYLAGDKEDFLTNVEIALDEKDDRIRELRRDIARRNDWTMISEVVDRELLKLVTP
jgi:glycosyltransferase involved in cell wall biosynthesis